MKRRITAFLLMLTILISMFPVITVEPEEVNAGMVYIEGLGNVELKYQGQNGYKIYLDAEKNLIVTGTYHHSSSATLSYHTSVLYFASRDSGKNPGGLAANECFSVGVEERHQTTIVESDSFVTYTVYRSELEDMITYLFGADGLKTEQKVYMSEGFRLTKRDSTSDTTWDIYGNVYSSLSGIQGAAGWSDTTYENFANYYDIALTLELTKYNITVEAGEGGSVGQSHDEAYAGDNVTINAYPDDNFNFTGWTIEEGVIPGFDSSLAESSFVMPSYDVVIKAHFEEKEVPPATKPPVATPTPGPTPTLAPTPTPEPTPTPPYMPSENSEVIQKSVRYYSTDAGYSIGGVYNKTVTPQDDAFGYVAVNGNSNKDSRFEDVFYTGKGSYSYREGTDASGNTWYFIPDGTKATFVHPKEYKGHAVDSADVRYISELTFPSTITSGGTTYTVTSIGGGTDKYCETGAERDGSAWFGEWSPSYNDYDEYINEVYTGEGLRQYTSKARYGRMLGVAGNGSVWSSYFLYEFYSNSTYEHFDFASSYYVYNTTLRYITIPDTVTKIEDFAFSGCQALEKIMGGKNVTAIGDNAFDAIDKQTLQKSYVKYHAEGYVQKFEYYYYNGSFTFDTATTTMQNWKNSVVLSSYMELPTFGSLKNIGVSSFELRKNLFDVVLPTSVVEIGANAFKDCALDKITVPGMSTQIGNLVRPSGTDRTNITPEKTLGTKGQGITPKTLIETEMSSKAMDYGMTYDAYYDVRAGYNVIYSNNSIPAESYVTKPRLVKNYATLKERLPLSYYDRNNSILFTQEVWRDENGGLYIVDDNNLPVRCLPELTFSNVYTFNLKSGNETMDANGFITSNCVDISCCLAFADSGVVYLYRTDTKKWTDLGIEALVGNSNFAFHKNSFGSGGQDVSQEEETLALYYIDGTGGLSQRTIFSQTQSANRYAAGTVTYYSYTLTPGTVSSVSLPNGISVIRRFCFNNERTSNPGYPPEINIEDGYGSCWTSLFGNWTACDSYAEKYLGYMEYQEEQEIYTTYGITDFGPCLVGYHQIETIYDLMFDSFGKAFLGWSLRADGAGVLYQPGQELKITAPTILYAKWIGEAKKTIQYIPNGGVGTMKDDIYAADEPNPVTLKKNAYVRNGYAFAGWGYKALPSPSDKIYADEEQIVIAPGITRLYAQWNPITYIVKVGFEDMRVTEQDFDEYILGLDEELVLGTKGDKSLTISYDLNDKEAQPSMHAKAEFVTELTEQNTEASLEFYGWRLYEDVNKDAKISEEDRYLGYYEPDAVVKNLATEKDAVFYAFPYWGGSASYVQLPEIICNGYMFVGYTPGTAYEPDYFETSEAFHQAIQENILISAPNGSRARYQPKEDGEVLYAYYEKEKQEGMAYGFEVYDVFGGHAWEEIRDTECNYTIGVSGDDSELWDTLPLRNGVHPLYCNLGGLPMGGGFSFRVKSTGGIAGADTTLMITPHFCPVGENGYDDGNLYFEQETDRGCFLKKWQPEEHISILYADKDSTMAEDGGSRIWSGSFRIPENLWLAEPNTDIAEYQQQFGLDFEETFWKKDVRLMLRFTLCFASESGECLYYGMLPEKSEENVWVQEAVESYREDYDKNQYEIFGGEVAVIYPGDSADRWNQIHGIY